MNSNPEPASDEKRCEHGQTGEHSDTIKPGLTRHCPGPPVVTPPAHADLCVHPGCTELGGCEGGVCFSHFSAAPSVSTDHTDETLQRRLFNECEQAGWDPEKRNSFAEECAHLHEEVSEAFRDWRLTKDASMVWFDADGKPRGVPIELADVLIGLFYNAELHGFDLLEAVEVKHQWNLRRDYQAEGRALHPVSEASRG